jgi:hypothetical protein
VWRARTGPAERIARISVDGLIVVFGQDRWRVVEIAELDVEIVDWRLKILGGSA